MLLDLHYKIKLTNLSKCYLNIHILSVVCILETKRNFELNVDMYLYCFYFMQFLLGISDMSIIMNVELWTIVSAKLIHFNLIIIGQGMFINQN